MYSQLLDAIQFAASLPPVMSNIASELNATAGLAAAVARNANDTEAQQLIEGASQIHPVAIAVVLLERLARTYNKSSRADLESLAIETMRNTLESIDWTDPRVWTDNQYNVRQILSLLAAATSNDQVRETIAAVLGENPDLLSTVIRACASWVEQVDINDWSSMSIMRHYSDLPDWFPTAQVVREINRQIPGATAADEFAAERLPEELDRLSSQILYLELTTGETELTKHKCSPKLAQCCRVAGLAIGGRNASTIVLTVEDVAWHRPHMVRAWASDSNADSNRAGRGRPGRRRDGRHSEVTARHGRRRTARPELTNEGSMIVVRADQRTSDSAKRSHICPTVGAGVTGC
jgi:hypothetical protein